MTKRILNSNGNDNFNFKFVTSWLGAFLEDECQVPVTEGGVHRFPFGLKINK